MRLDGEFDRRYIPNRIIKRGVFGMKDLRILIVDDDVKYRSWVEQALRSKGYARVRTVSNAVEALEAIRTERPNLVLLDLYLPGMDGLHLLREIHTLDKNIPVFMLTCESDEECINAAVGLGAANYLIKPLTMSSLITSLETCL
jgi:two-component system response regulator MtrA